MKLILQTANIVGDEKNCLYPNRVEVTSAEELQEAVKMDHVCAEYDNDYRSKENFRQSNVLVMDCDNDHTENPAEWITPEKLDEMMPDISYAIAFSRHHMLEKNGKAPRPKFHVYFEIEPTQDADYYASLKEAIYRKYTFFDDNALDAARFIFGADVGDAIWHEGWLTIDSEVEIGTPIERNDTGRVGNVIIAGTRNKTMSKFAGRVIIRYGNTDKAHQIFMDEAAKCEPPLDDEELATIWASAVRWYEKKISKQDGYVPPDQYNTQEFMSLKPGDYSDIGEAKVLAREYGDELRFTDSTDLIRYNGIYWQESKQMAIGAMMEFLDLQLQDAKDQVAATKQALLDSGVSQLCSTDEIEAEKKYKDPFKYVPTHTMVLYTNHLPKVGASDDGTWRRLIVIPFGAKIQGKTDIKNYTDYLVENASSYIMTWVIEGAKKAIDAGFKLHPPKCVQDAINAYREGNDWLGHFLEECCDVDPALKEKSGSLYQQYRAFSTENGEYVRSTTDFYSALEGAGFERKRLKEGRMVQGLKLKAGQDFA